MVVNKLFCAVDACGTKYCEYDPIVKQRRRMARAKSENQKLDIQISNFGSWRPFDVAGRAGAKNIRIRESSPPGKFAQAAETFNDSSTTFLLTARRQAI
jgi:hypothetical protein